MHPTDVIESLMVGSMGWTTGRIALSASPDRGFDGLIDPEGRPWEAVSLTMDPRSVSKKALVDMARQVDYQLRSGCAVCLLELDGQWYLAERLPRADTTLQVFDGIHFDRPWRDVSCGGSPDQWDRFGTFRGEPVCLYLRWRWSDPWTGHLIRGAYDMFRSIYCPWTENLLPTEIVTSAPPPDLMPGWFLMSKLRGERTVSTPAAFLRDQHRQAREALEALAGPWLRENWDNKEAWSR